MQMGKLQPVFLANYLRQKIIAFLDTIFERYIFHALCISGCKKFKQGARHLDLKQKPANNF